MEVQAFQRGPSKPYEFSRPSPCVYVEAQGGSDLAVRSSLATEAGSGPISLHGLPCHPHLERRVMVAWFRNVLISSCREQTSDSSFHRCPISGLWLELRLGQVQFDSARPWLGDTAAATKVFEDWP